MNVVDSSGWLENFAGSASASFFTPAIEDSEHLLVPTISLFEVFKRLIGQNGLSAAQTSIGDMYSGQVIDLDASIALRAAQISRELKLPMADSIILATAREYGATLWTQDEHFREIPEVKFIEKAA